MATPILKAEDIARRVDVDPRLLEGSCEETVLPPLAAFVHPWREVFGFLLAPLDLDDVNAECHSEQEKRLSSLRKWKERHGTEATYAELINALLKNGSVDKAEALCRHIQTISNEQEMVAAQSVGGVNVASDQQDVAQSAKKQVVNKIKRLEYRFLTLKDELLSELTTNEAVTPQILLRSLIILPVSLQTLYKKFILENLSTLMTADSIIMMFAHLSFHVTFIDYSLLEHLIEKFGSEKLKRDMSSYAVSMQLFLDETTVQEMIDFNWPGQQELPPNFEKLRAVINGNPRTYTLRKLDNLRKTMCRETQLSEIVFIFIGAANANSFVVSLMVHSVFIAVVKEAINRIDDTVCESENIISMSLNQQYLYLSPASRQKKMECERRLITLCVDKVGDINEFSHLLHQPGVDPNIHDQNVNAVQRGWTILCHVCYDGRYEIAKLLILHRANVNLPNREGLTPLMLASQEGHVDVASTLIHHGADVNRQDEKGQTPLQRVCLYKEKHIERRSEIVKLLLDHGARLHIEDKNGRTPLFAASTSGFIDVVKILLERVSKLPERKQRRMLNHIMMNGWTIIMDAALHGHAEVIKLLLEAGAVAIKTKEDDETALHIAAYHGHVDVVRVLTEKRDRLAVNARDQYGLTPLMMATIQNHTETANVLVEAGADVNLRSNDETRRTALMFAAKQGCKEILQMLLKYKPDVHIKDSQNKTVFDLAKTPEIQHCLRELPVTKPEVEIDVSH